MAVGVERPMKLKPFLAFGAFGIAASSLAQQLPHVDITLADNGADQLEVRIRPTADFNQMASNLVFTLRWQEQFGPALTPVAPVYPQSEYLPLSTMDLMNGGNGFLYRTFSAVAMAPMSEFGAAWQGGVEYPVCTLDVLTPGVEVILGNDDFTTANNRDFFMSLNGVDRTGGFFESPVPGVRASAVNSGNGYIDVLLTPEDDYFGWVNEIGFTLRWPANGSNLGAIIQTDAMLENLPIAKVGPEITLNGFTYQRFHGEGTRSLAVSHLGWTSNEDHQLLRIPVIGAIADATVADDAWTSTNDGAYSIVLNGQQRADGTDELLTSTGPVFAEVIPAMQVVGDELRVTTSPNGSGTLLLTVLNASGQPIAQHRAKWGVVERISLSGVSSGIYVLRASTTAGPAARRFLY